MQEGKAYPSVKEALEAAREDAQTQDIILVTGSFFIVGEAIAGIREIKSCFNKNLYFPSESHTGFQLACLYFPAIVIIPFLQTFPEVAEQESNKAIVSELQHMGQLMTDPGLVFQEIGPRRIVQVDRAAQCNGHGPGPQFPCSQPGQPAPFFDPDFHVLYLHQDTGNRPFAYFCKTTPACRTGINSMMQVKDILSEIERFAPLPYQESYDNCGVQVGNIAAEARGALLSLDVTEEVLEEAIVNNCNLIIAHHPLIFSGLKSITGRNYVERVILKAIKHDIVIYAAHTNLDNVQAGVNHKIAEKVGP